jgi:hypothetical protein
MIKLLLEEKEAKEFLTFLYNQRNWIEGAIKREEDNLRKVRLENTLKLLNPIITKLEGAFTESFEPQKSDTDIARKKGITIICKMCKWKAYLNSYSINDKKKVLEFWRCPQLHDPKNYEIFEGEVDI